MVLEIVFFIFTSSKFSSKLPVLQVILHVMVAKIKQLSSSLVLRLRNWLPGQNLVNHTKRKAIFCFPYLVFLKILTCNVYFVSLKSYAYMEEIYPIDSAYFCM
jgi:hypothetical protein